MYPLIQMLEVFNWLLHNMKYRPSVPTSWCLAAEAFYPIELLQYSCNLDEIIQDACTRPTAASRFSPVFLLQTCSA